MKKKYLVKRMLLIDNKVAELDLSSIIADEKERREASVILHVMSFRFLESFHKLTTVPSLGAVHSVSDQVQQMMAKFANMSIDEIFPDRTTQEHSYYILGFIGHQAAKQADRRSKRGMVFKLLTHFSSTHFVTKANVEEYTTIVADGAIPTGLVERRMAFGGLKFASKQSWAIFAKIDGMYSLLATPENFVFVGGTLSGDICNAIVENPTMQQLFYGLLHQDYNPGSRVIDSALKDALADSFAYVMKVFSRVRGKDVSRKFNSNRFSGNQVNFRSGIGATTGKKKKKRTRGNTRSAGIDTTTSVEEANEATAEEEEVELNEHESLLAELDELDDEEDPDNEVTRKIMTEDIRLDEEELGSDAESDDESYIDE
jgi:hypothetical protein